MEASVVIGKGAKSLSGVSSTLTLRIERESSLSVVEDTAPEPYPLKHKHNVNENSF